MAEETPHILETLISKIKANLDNSEAKVYLAANDAGEEFLAIQSGSFEQGLNIDQVINSYAVYRIYQANSEEEALDKLSESLASSIADMIKAAATPEENKE